MAVLLQERKISSFDDRSELSASYLDLGSEEVEVISGLAHFDLTHLSRTLLSYRLHLTLPRA